MAFPTADETKEVTRLQLAVTQAFLSHKPHGTALMIWSDEQRAIGERMIVEERGELLCMGYAAFSEACEGVFAPWCARLDDELGDEQAQERMKDVQAALCELVITLDPEHLRYPLTHLQPVEKLAE
jgi:hypothetical protein